MKKLSSFKKTARVFIPCIMMLFCFFTCKKEKKYINAPINTNNIPMAICPKCGNIGIGEETIGMQCSCGEKTIRCTDVALNEFRSK